MQDRSRWIALGVLCTGMLMIVLDMTIVNVALPSIQTDLGFSESSLAWVVNAYLIAFAGLLLLAGRLGDLAGRRNVFLAGLGIFTAASALCGLAENQEMLVAARFPQGGGGAFTSAVILGMIVTMFSDPREQARTLGLGACSLVLLGAFIIRQRLARNPLMPLRIFSSRNVTGANLVQVLGTAGMFGMFFLARSTCAGFSAMTRSGSAWPSCPSRS